MNKNKTSIIPKKGIVYANLDKQLKEVFIDNTVINYPPLEQKSSRCYKMTIEDPVWGVSNLNGFHDILVSSYCPCFLGGWGELFSIEKKNIYKKILSSCSFWLMISQTIVFLAEIICRNLSFFKMSLEVVLFDFGDRDTYAICYNYEIYRLITPIFLSGGIIHFIANLYGEFRFCLTKEFQWGRMEILNIFLAGAVSGNLLSTVLIPKEDGVGGSSGIMSVMGAWTMELILSRKYKKICMITLMMGLLFLTSFIPGIDWATHLGGYCMGLICCPEILKNRPWVRRLIIWSFLQFMIIILIIYREKCIKLL